MVQFLAPETDKNFQFLAQETGKMCQQNSWSQKLTKWFSFWGQKLYVMGEWNSIVILGLESTRSDGSGLNRVKWPP